MRFGFIVWLSLVLSLISATQGAGQYHTTTPVDTLPSLEASCESGNVNGCEFLVHYYDSIAKHGGDRGLTVDQAFTLKLDWAGQSCDAGGAYGCDASGWAYEHGQESRNQDFAKAFDYYTKGCAVRSGLSCNNLALAYRHGRGTPANEALAEQYFGKACQYSYTDACPKDPAPKEATKTADSEQSYADYLKAYRLDNFRTSCDSGNAESCWALGWEEVKNQTIQRGSAAFKAHMSKACDMGHAEACKDMNISARPASAQAPATNRATNPKTMDFTTLQTACSQNRQFGACTELYDRARGDMSDSYLVAEFICDYWNRGDYCHTAGIDLYSGGANVESDRQRAYNNFHRGCYNRSMESCYMAGYMAFSGDGIRTDVGEAYMLFNMSCTGGYRDSCALMRKAKRANDRAVEARNRGIRQNSDDAMNCRKTRIVGNGGRTYTSYDCRTNRQWRTGKK